MDFSGSGDITAPTQEPLEFGCWPENYVDFVPGNIAIIKRGACAFAQKSFFAEIVGQARAVVIYNDGDPLNPQGDRFVAIDGTLFGPGAQIPVVGTSYTVGLELAEEGVEARVFVDMPISVITDTNVFAETQYGDPDNVIVVGAHIDSVDVGPGIQDNGSGVAAVLEVALQMRKVEPLNKVRFAFWGGEELGLLGSFAYLQSLSQEEGEAIAAYLNFDMIASPNYAMKILNGGAATSGGSALEDLFQQFYNSRGLGYVSQPLLCLSDYCGFLNAGIPVSGIFTGINQLKTEEEEEMFGGKAGEPYDACYHAECDTIDNVSSEALDINSDAIAYVTLVLAMSTETVNGGESKGNFQPSKLARDAIEKAPYDHLGDKFSK